MSQNAAVHVPEWLKKLPLAPEFHPTETEFADPIAYISKIEREASAFGICKIIPPIPKPSKKYVFANLNRSLLRRPEVVSRGANLPGTKSGCGENVGGARALFTTRQQELGQCVNSKKGNKGAGGSLQQPASQKQVWQSGEFYTLEQFESKAKGFSRSLLRKCEEVTPLVVETLFWKAACEKPIYVEYANDVPGSGFSEPVGAVRRFDGHKTGRRRSLSQNSGKNPEDVQPSTSRNDSGMNGEVNASTRDGTIPNSLSAEACNDLSSKLSSDAVSKVSNQRDALSDHEWEGTAGWKLSNSPWNLQVISRSAGSLTRFMVDDIPGVTSPMVYIGMLFSWFAWHVEDHELHSLNFLHVGSPKTWYSVPGDHAHHFEEVVRTEAYGGNMDALGALKILGEKTTIFSPEAFVRNGIPCCRLVQNPGEFVVTFPRAYHIGFSHGFNCGEAANFGTSQWLKVAKEAAVRRTTMDQLPMLSHQQLLYLLTVSFVSRLPSSLIPGVRSSRLRNRLKEEREQLVKKALIEDILEENILLNVLRQRDSSFRAVLWNSDMLLPYSLENSSLSLTASRITTSRTVEQSVRLNDNSDRMKLHMETMDDLDIIDLSGDFEISSGALQCVACGILGFPFMCVIQPSKKASEEIFPTNCISMQKSPGSPRSKLYNFKSTIPVVNDARWNASCGIMRPRLFCLEHAVQIEGLLRPKGGADILIICHSDYQKIKPNALTIVEETGCAFDYKEVALDPASGEDLDLIYRAIDDDKQNQCTEDWTSKLGVSLKHHVRMKKTSLAKQIEHTLNFSGLFPVRTSTTSNISNIRWLSRKSRCKPENMRKCLVSEKTADKNKDISPVCNSIELTKNCDFVKGNPESSTPGNTKVLLQYSRRKYRKRSSDSLQSSGNLGCTNSNPLEVAPVFDFGPICRQENIVSGHGGRENFECAAISASSGGGHHEKESENTNVAVESSVITEQAENQIPEKMVGETEGSALTTLECCKSCHAVKLDAHSCEVNEISDAENSCLSTFASPECHKNRENGIAANAKNDGDADGKPLHLNRWSEAHSSLDGKSSSALVGDNTSRVPAVSDDKESINVDIQASCPLTTGKPKEDGPVHQTPSLRNQSQNKRKREAVGLTDFNVNLNQDGFVKSPCEGLRPRVRKEESTSSSNSSKRGNAVEQSPMSKKKKPSVNSSNADREEKGAENAKEKNRHRSDVDQSKMQFNARADKQNGCPDEKCGKKLSSHKKALTHQRRRIHDRERRLKCTVENGSARTDHMKKSQVNKKQQRPPYKCKVSGCGRSFRFPSEFTRHRRRTGHGESDDNPA